MHTVKTDIEIDYKAVCTLNGQNVDCILEDICLACHEGIEEISYIRQTIDEGGDEDIPNTVETWHLDGRDYYKGYFVLWEDLDRLSERIVSNDDIFDSFVKEWKKLKYGFRFNTES